MNNTKPKVSYKKHLRIWVCTQGEAVGYGPTRREAWDDMHSVIHFLTYGQPHVRARHPNQPECRA